MSYPLLLLIVAAPLLVAGNIYLLGRKMSEPEKMMQPLTGLTPSQQQSILRYKDWLASVRLEYRTSFQFGNIQVAVFQQGNEPRFLSFHFHQRVTLGIETYFEDLALLDTSTAPGVGLFPRPGAYAQSFPNCPLEELWRRHLEAEAHLVQKFGLRPASLTQTYGQLLVEAVRVRMKHNRAQFLWPFRVLYRYAVTQHRLVNRPIAQQFP